MTILHGTWRGCNVAMANGQLFIEQQDKPNLTGGIARGKVDRIVGKAAFVKLPKGAMGYLDKAKSVKPGDEILVQVSGYASEDKAWPLSTELKLQSRAFIYLPHGKGIAVSKKLEAEEGETLKMQLQIHTAIHNAKGGWIVRSAAVDEKGNEAQVRDLVAKAAALEGKGNDWLVEPTGVLARAMLESGDEHTQLLDADDMDELMRPLTARDIRLPSGGRIHLGLTRALCAIDVDAGSCPNARKVGEEAADAIAQAVRNRAIGGQIVIDPLRASETFLDELFIALMHDNLSVTLYGRTKMGLIELSRPRTGPNLFEVMDD